MKFQELNESFERKYGITDDEEILDKNSNSELEEGIVGDVVNVGRGVVNNLGAKAMDKLANYNYKKGNYTQGRRQRMRAAELKANAQDAYTDAKTNDPAKRTIRQAKNASALDKNLSKADAEYEKKSNKYISRVIDTFDKCKTKREVDILYNTYLNQLSRRGLNRISDNDPTYLKLQNAYEQARGRF